MLTGMFPFGIYSYGKKTQSQRQRVLKHGDSDLHLDLQILT